MAEGGTAAARQLAVDRAEMRRLSGTAGAAAAAAVVAAGGWANLAADVAWQGVKGAARGVWGECAARGKVRGGGYASCGGAKGGVA